jgi:hypothetical protein
VTLSAWARSPHGGQTVLTALVWWIALDNFYRCFTDLRQRHEEHRTSQATRMACEARGGFYGARAGGEERCLRDTWKVSRTEGSKVLGAGER